MQVDMLEDDQELRVGSMTLDSICMYTNIRTRTYEPEVALEMHV